MGYRFVKRILIATFALLACLTGHAQRSGNIVEYFGKEKIENVEEGSVIHQFKVGLALESAMPSGSLWVGQDILAWQLAFGLFKEPNAGQIHETSYPRAKKNVLWKSVQADSVSTFRNLENTYLYTTFESPSESVVLLDATGHTRVYINGLPHEGDHYDYGYTLIPFKLKKGLNEFIFTPGRFGRVKARLVLPKNHIMLCRRDPTLPSLIRSENTEKWAAIRVINATNRDWEKLTIVCKLSSGEESHFTTDKILALSMRKLKFLVPAPLQYDDHKQITASIFLLDRTGKEIDRTTILLNQMDKNKHHERTFVSEIDGSVQYYSVVPSLSSEPGQAFILSLHGASVEAINQTRAYKQKDWAYIVAPTNRRPFGFNWEEWGRIDAFEVMADAKKILKTSPSQTYLTGHSMGGHGTWFLGATYPGTFAAIAPCAGYPDIIGYRKDVDTANAHFPHYTMIKRGAAAGRVYDLKRNFLQSGVYVLHGSNDQVVPVNQARTMREELGKFHDNFCYYEYPDGSHWYGDHSMDWPPLFDFLRQNTIPVSDSIKHIEFHTVSPGVSSRNHWLEVIQQKQASQVSTLVFNKSADTIRGKTTNVACQKIFISTLGFMNQPVIEIDGQVIPAITKQDMILKLNEGKWSIIDRIEQGEKHPLRYGGFKMAYTNRAVLVYATAGSKQENEWNKNRARFDAETFLYRGNGSFDIVADKDFNPADYADRNVILYGNADNNLAWKKLLQHCPIQVRNNSIAVGTRNYSGKDLGALFIYPRPDSDFASVGVVAASGVEGMKGNVGNNYFSGVTGYPDILIFDAGMLKDGLASVKVSGFFDNNWGLNEAGLIFE